MDFSREQLMEGKAMQERNAKIREVLATIPQEQYDPNQTYTDKKDKKGWRNPVRPIVAEGLTKIVDTLGFKNGVELGTALGSSGLRFALGGLKHLDTCEFDPEAATIAQQNFAKAEVPYMVYNMDSGDFVRDHQAPIDLLFIDHAKERYLEDFQGLEHLLEPKALVLMDNTFNRASECQDAVAYVANWGYAAIFTEPPSMGQDGLESTGLLVASKDRYTFNMAMKCLLDVRAG